MKQSVRKRVLRFVHWMAGLCAVAGLIASLRGIYGMCQVWTGEITTVPLIGALTHPSQVDSATGLLLSLFEVGFGGLAYAFVWTIPAGIVLAVLAMIARQLEKPRTDTLKFVQ